jgi:hypothetical protein
VSSEAKSAPGSQPELIGPVWLSSLPAQPWQWASFKTVTVHIDYHVCH